MAAPDVVNRTTILAGAALVALPFWRSRTPSLKRLQELDEIGLLSSCEMQSEVPVIVIHYGREIGGAAVVKVRRVLPQRAQRRRAVLAGCAPVGIPRIRPDRGGIVQQRDTAIPAAS